MSRLHICNTFFEKELESKQTRDLAGWMRSHPIVLQLQFLPLLYAAQEDRILVSDLPENPDPRLCLIDDPPKGYAIEHWGPSLAIEHWAKQHGIPYALPDWKIVQEFNSKLFSFQNSPQLPHSAVLNSQKQAEEWLSSFEGPKVLKTPFGTAGSGHILNPLKGKNYNFPLIGEPWVERTLDFSTQWENGKLLGTTVFENESNGTYKKTVAAAVDQKMLQQHLAIAEPLVQRIARQGYLGQIGVDSFIYLWQKEQKLHPVVEINARKTMSWAALQLPQKTLCYKKTEQGFLPRCLRIGGKLHFFARNVQ